jgi:hypothetical protein
MISRWSGRVGVQLIATAAVILAVENWDQMEIDGDIASKYWLLRLKRNGRVLSVASIFRDRASPQAELMMERAAA